MTDELSLTLSWFANFTNFYSVLSVLICFFVMVVFILRLNGENLVTSATHYPVVKEQCMVSLVNPFSVQLNSNISSSLKDGLHLCVSVKAAAKMKVLWAVGIEAFQKELQLSTHKIADRLNDNKVFDAHFKHDMDCGLLSGNGEKEMYFHCPAELTAETLGEPPRMLYPVVIFTSLEDQQASQETAIVLQLTIIHLKDSICSLDSHIVYQFVKTNTNKLISLQPIYMATTEPLSSSEIEPPSRNTKKTTTVTNGVQGQSSSNTVRQGQGHSMCSISRALQHCSVCGKLQSGIKDIPSTRAHEICKCEKESANCDPYQRSPAERSKVNDSELEDVVFKMTDWEEKSKTNFNLCKKELVEDKTNLEVERKDTSNENEAIDGTDVGKQDVEENVDNRINFEDSESCCVVCQSSAIFYTLLPCRHACVCSTCIRHLDKCPICRSYIEAYFRLHSRYSENHLQESMETVDAGPRLNRWQAFNQRLNEMLGFV